MLRDPSTASTASTGSATTKQSALLTGSFTGVFALLRNPYQGPLQEASHCFATLISVLYRRLRTASQRVLSLDKVFYNNTYVLDIISLKR